jgi:hypothetical protein
VLQVAKPKSGEFAGLVGEAFLILRTGATIDIDEWTDEWTLCAAPTMWPRIFSDASFTILLYCTFLLPLFGLGDAWWLWAMYMTFIYGCLLFLIAKKLYPGLPSTFHAGLDMMFEFGSNPVVDIIKVTCILAVLPGMVLFGFTCSCFLIYPDITWYLPSLTVILYGTMFQWFAISDVIGFNAWPVNQTCAVLWQDPIADGIWALA